MANRLFPDAVGPRMTIPGFSSDTDLSKLEVIANAGQQQKDYGQREDPQNL
jgi:hypothetical protein